MFARLPPAAEPLIRSFAPAFTRPSFARFALLLVGAIVTFGRRTVSRILWTLGPAAADGAGHPSSFHRFFSQARWSPWPLARILSAAVLELLPHDAPVRLAVDDTVFGHRGKRVWGKGCHRDPVRSPHDPDRVVYKWGHKWVVLAVLVPLPFTATRRWALPVLCALYRVPKVNRELGRRHKTPCDLARGLVSAMLHWFPDRRFILLGDGAFASHDLAWFCHKRCRRQRQRRRLTLIARACKEMNLHALPSPNATPPCRSTLWRRRVGICRPRCRKGRKLPSPADTVAAARAGRGLAPGGGVLPTATVQWYGQSRRELEVLSACGGWYRPRGNGTGALVPVRWLYTHDPQTGKQDWFFCTDPTHAPPAIIEDFAGRWSIEVTFEEGRAHLGWETTRQRCERSVLRCAPCLIGLFSLIALIFARLWRERDADRARGHGHGHGHGNWNGSWNWNWTHHTPCYHKAEPTFADALYAVRRVLWDGCLLKHVLGPRRVTMLPRQIKRTLITYLAEAG